MLVVVGFMGVGGWSNKALAHECTLGWDTYISAQFSPASIRLFKLTLRQGQSAFLFLILQIYWKSCLRRRPLNKVCLVLAPPEIRGDGPPLSEGREAAAGGLGGDQGGEAAAQPGHQAPQGVQEGPARLHRPLQPAAAQYLMYGLFVTVTVGAHAYYG